MNTRVTLLAAAALALLLTQARPLALAQEKKPAGGDGRPPLVQWMGPDSKRTRAGFELVQTDEAWRKLWAEHTGKPLDNGGAMGRHFAPEIDFAQGTVVAYFRGKSQNTDGEAADSVQEFPDHILLRFTSCGFQTEGPGGGGVNVVSFGIWLIPATTKPIVIEEGSRELLSEPIKWHEVTRLQPKARPEGR